MEQLWRTTTWRSFLPMRAIFVAGIMLFFWAMFDGSISFIAPILITERGYTDAQMGLLLAFSSVAGGIFDVLIGKFLTNPHWKRVFLFMFLSCAITGLVLFQASLVSTMLLAMALWGLYYNFSNFTTFDFVSVVASENERGRTYGILEIFHALGYIFSPLILGILIVSVVTGQSFVFLGIMLVISFIFLIVLSRLPELNSASRERRIRPQIHKALHSAFRDGGKLLSVLSFIVMYNTVEAFFWTIGPLLAVQFAYVHPWGGFFLSAYYLPILITGWFVGKITLKFGKKRSALFSFALGNVFLVLFLFLANSPYALMVLIFFASFFITFSSPCMNAAFVDYISEDRRDEGHLEALNDFSANTGYVIGPIVAGFLAGSLGAVNAFSVGGVAALIITFILWKVTPRSINLVRSAR